MRTFDGLGGGPYQPKPHGAIEYSPHFPSTETINNSKAIKNLREERIKKRNDACIKKNSREQKMKKQTDTCTLSISNDYYPNNAHNQKLNKSSIFHKAPIK